MPGWPRGVPLVGIMLAGAVMIGLVSGTAGCKSPTPPSCAYTLQTPSTLTFDMSGGTGTVSVSTGSSCRWYADRSAVIEDWVMLSTVTKTGSGQVNFTVRSAAALPQVPLPRVGPIYVFSEETNERLLAVQVEQR